MKLISWNVAGRVTRLDAQAEALMARCPDVVTFQEITAKTAPLWKMKLIAAGLISIVDSFQLAPDPACLVGRRRYGQMIASRWPLEGLPPNNFNVPWPERILSVIVHSPCQDLEVHTTGIPPGISNGWTKIEMLEGLYQGLARRAERPRILCGDFNTPQKETSDGQVITWGTRRDDRWDLGERNVLTGLAPFDLADVYRLLHGYSSEDYSWYWQHSGRRGGRRFDHVFASRSLNPKDCRYLHLFREEGLSDHSAIEVRFEPTVSAEMESSRQWGENLDGLTMSPR